MGDFDPIRHIEAMAPALGLEIAEAWRPGVAAFLVVAADFAAALDRFAETEALEHGAAVFRPGAAL